MINVTDYDSRNDAGRQLQNAQDAITAGLDLLILSPTDSSAAPTVLELAAENNVPVVIADIGTDEGEYVSFVISSNESGAYESGKVLMEKMAEMGCEGGDVIMITISQARLNGQNRTKGITRAVEEAGSKIVQFLQSEDYTRAEAQTQASDLLSANPEACGFFTQHDEAALGTFAALEESGRAESVAFASFDGSPESVELIRQGKLVASSMQQPVLMGRISLEVGLKHLRGEEVEKETEVPTILVTPDNLADVEAQLQDTVFPVEDGAATPTT
jgi:ribose transport system substrate-binding protein